MILILQIALFKSFNLVLELVIILLRPLLSIFLKRLSYDSALQFGGASISGGVLFHAASLGEVNAVRSLVLELCNHLSPSRIAISTTTVTGLAAASKIHPGIKAHLSVLDVASLRRAQLRELRPGLICIVETEIWPNLLYCSKLEGIPILFLNARLSPKSARRLRLIKPLITYIGSSIVEILAKSDEDASRFREIFQTPVHMAGNLKFALKPQDYDNNELRRLWGYNEHDLLVCAGSTRPGEEALLLKSYKELFRRHPSFKLIIAPRHPQRIDEVKKLFGEVDFGLHSNLDKSASAKQIMIIDSLGHLNEAYSICDLAIVGGSFTDFGGHNPLEPAYYCKAIIIGPFHNSCLESVRELAREKAIIVSSDKELVGNIQELLDNPDERLAMGHRAKEVINRFQNSLSLHLEGILRWIS